MLVELKLNMKPQTQPDLKKLVYFPFMSEVNMAIYWLSLKQIKTSRILILKARGKRFTKLMVKKEIIKNISAIFELEMTFFNFI